MKHAKNRRYQPRLTSRHEQTLVNNFYNLIREDHFGRTCINQNDRTVSHSHGPEQVCITVYQKHATTETEHVAHRVCATVNADWLNDSAIAAWATPNPNHTKHADQPHDWNITLTYNDYLRLIRTQQ